MDTVLETWNNRDMWLWLGGRPFLGKSDFLRHCGFTVEQTIMCTDGSPQSQCYLCSKHRQDHRCCECPLHLRWRYYAGIAGAGNSGIFEGCMTLQSYYQRWRSCRGFGRRVTRPNQHMAHIWAMRLADAETWSNGRYPS